MRIDGVGEFISRIICDDIRREENGKLIIIGTYTGDILISSLPSVLVLRIFAEFQADALGSFPLDFHLEFDGKRIALLEGAVNQETLPGSIAMALPPVPLEFPAEGTFRIFAQSGDKRALFMEKKVNLSSTL